MRFEAIRAKGLGPFRDEIAVDLASIDAQIVAVTGENGAGKSTLLELFAGALYRTCPTRGPLSSLATARDAFLEVEVVNGALHRIRHVVDAVSGKGEAVVTDAEGRPRVASGKLREYDSWASKHLPPPEVLYSSTFAAQGSGGFLDLKPGERKGVLLRVLGIERLEALAEKAREHARSTKSAIAILDARIADEKRRASDPAAVAAELDVLVAKRKELEAAVAAERSCLEELVAQEQRAKEAQRAAEENRRRRSDLERQIAELKAQRADLEKRIGNNADLLARRDEIRKAQEGASALDAKLVELDKKIAEARAAEKAAARELETARKALDDVRSRSVSARERRDRLVERVADKAMVESARESLPGLRDVVTGAEGAVAALEAAIKATTDLAMHGASKRIDGLRGALQTIADGAEQPDVEARTALDSDDRAARDADEAPKKLTEQRRMLDEVRADLATKRRELADAERLAARSAEIEAAEAELAESKVEIARLETELKAADEACLAADESRRAKAEAVDALVRELDEAQGARAKLDPLLRLVDRLMQAEARISELSPQVDGAKAEIERLDRELAELPPEPGPVALPDVAGARQKVDALDRELRATEAAIAVKESQLADARETASRLRELESERRKADEELADWTRLSEDLGRDGLQAAEVECAGPELTEIANQLLHEAFGSRFTVRFDTTRRSADGKREIEGFDIHVIDTERGRDALVESLSGGERVIVGEAISLALSTLACRRSGIERPTLVRDESGAALDEGRAGAYVRMLRRAAELIGADKVLLVSHTPSVWDLCDARLEVANGQVRVAA